MDKGSSKDPENLEFGTGAGLARNVAEVSGITGTYRNRENPQRTTLNNCMSYRHLFVPQGTKGL